MKNNIIKTACIILVAILLSLSSNVYAVSDSFKTKLKVDNTTIKRGDNITVTIALSDIAIESGEKGIGAYTAKLEFDTSILEYVSTSGTDKWEKPLYKDTRIVGNTNDGEVVNTEQDIGSITFKVKEDAKLGETTIKLTNFSGSTAESNVSAADVSINITISEKDSENGNGSGSGNEGEDKNGTGSTGENGTGNGNSGENGNGSTNGNGASGQNGNGNTSGNGTGNTQDGKNSGSSNKKDTLPSVLPKTGEPSALIYIILGIVGLLAINFVAGIKLLSKKTKKQ